MANAALLAIVVSLWLGAELGAGVHRSRPLTVLRACWPILALLVLMQLARFASNMNDQGGDVTDQTLTAVLAWVQLPLYGVAALGGRVYRPAVGPKVAVESATSLLVARGLRNRLAAWPTLTVARPRSGSRFWKVVGMRIATALVALVVWGVVELVEQARSDNRPYPRTLPSQGRDGPASTDYGPSFGGAARAAGVPILWFGPSAFGLSLRDASLTQREGVDFPPSAEVLYDDNAELHALRALRWVCSPARTPCSGWVRPALR
jgi:hypothetical protein